MAGFALSEVAEIRQQLAGICEERAGHLVLQHCMLSIAAAFRNPQVGPSTTSRRVSSNIVNALRTEIILDPILGSGK